MPGSSLGYQLVILTVVDVIKGEAPQEITIKRVGLTENEELLFTEFSPNFYNGERFIICLVPKEDNYHLMLGFYRGKFVIENGLIKDTNIPLAHFKRMIHEILDGTRSHFPPELPRPIFVNSKSMRNNLTTFKGQNEFTIAQVGSHLDGQFETYNETWNPNNLPVKFRYNHSNVPVIVSDSTVMARIQDAFDVWNAVPMSFLNLEFDDPATTNEGLVSNQTNVILWRDLGIGGFIAVETPNPSSRNEGPESKVGSDISFNYNATNGRDPAGWHFGSSPPSTRTFANIDFADVLVHELGHTQGLNHTNLNTTIMYSQWPQVQVFPLRTLANGDKAGRVYQHTEASGTVDFDMVWTANPEMQVVGDVTIASGKLLEIEEGKTIKFNSAKKLTINGTLNVNGQSGSEVTFTRTGTSGTWSGIQFQTGSSGTIAYATIEHATKGVFVSNTNNVTIDNCTIQNFTEQGIYAQSSALTIKNSTINNPGAGSHAVIVTGVAPVSAAANVFNNIIENPGNIGLEVSNNLDGVQVHDNTIRNCAYGVNLGLSNAEIFNNYIEDCSNGGIRILQDATPDIHDNDILLIPQGCSLIRASHRI